MPTNFASRGFNDVVSVSMDIILFSFNFSINLDNFFSSSTQSNFEVSTLIIFFCIYIFEFFIWFAIKTYSLA